jgi:hypothetical protein
LTPQLEHLPEPPASPAISSMAYEDSSSLVSKGDTKTGKTPSANRLSVSYARSNRRLVINAEVVETLKLFRQEGRIEVVIKVQKQEDGTLRGILVGFICRYRCLFSSLCRLKDFPKLPSLTCLFLLLLRNLLNMMRLCLLFSKLLQQISNFLYILILLDLCQNPSGPRQVISRIGSRACLGECFGWLAKQQTAGRRRYKWLILIQ